MAKYPRGFTAKSQHPPEKRPPKLKGRVSNDLFPDPARSAVMPPPTKDTQEPILSKFKGKKGLSKGRR